MSLLLYLTGLAIVGAIAAFVAAPLLRTTVRAATAPSTDPERYRFEKEKELAYAALKEAEFDFQMGKLSPEDYAILRQKYEARALAALAALERCG